MDIFLKISALLCAIIGTVLIITKAAPLPVAIGISVLGIALLNIANFMK